ncbi:hypothetical protein ACQKQA_13590 [Pseudomonas sp. NPDC089530]|uniref:hypothetical protein n=1 Tax=Pseudomonas sp. NPDC089530 TaxID=3390651 RepID=UPI003D0653CD
MKRLAILTLTLCTLLLGGCYTYWDDDGHYYRDHDRWRDHGRYYRDNDQGNGWYDRRDYRRDHDRHHRHDDDDD